MSIRGIRDYLDDILMAVDDIHAFVQGMDFQVFAADKKTVNAVIRSLEVMGEATKKIPTEIRNQHPQVPWREIAAMRDKLIHEYFGVDLEIVWATIQEDMDGLQQAVRHILNTLKA